MNKIIENIKDFLFFITHPSYFIMNEKYSKEYDMLFNKLLDEYEFYDYDYHTIKLGNTTFWIRNIPYSCFTTHESHLTGYMDDKELRPSRRSIHKALKKLTKFLVDRELNGIKIMSNIRLSDFTYNNNLTSEDIKETLSELIYAHKEEYNVDEGDIEDLINGKVIETKDYLSIERIINELSYMHHNVIFSYICYNIKENSSYKVYFKGGKDYSVEGKLVFEDFNIDKIK